MNIVPPIVVGPPDETLVFATVQDAEAYLEPWFMGEDRPVWDSEGKRLLALDEGKVTLTLRVPELRDLEGLRQILSQFLLDREPLEASTEALLLSQLLDRAVKHATR